MMAIVILLLSCSNSKQYKSTDEDNICLPGYIWIEYVGITDKISRFTLIRTSEKDSSFFSTSYYANWSEPVWSSDEVFRIYCNNVLVNRDLLNKLKIHILSHNTYKKVELATIDNYNAVRVVYVDSCDSIEYVVNNENVNYFSNIIDSLQIMDKSIIKILNYYESKLALDIGRKIY